MDHWVRRHGMEYIWSMWIYEYFLIIGCHDNYQYLTLTQCDGNGTANDRGHYENSANRAVEPINNK